MTEKLPNPGSDEAIERGCVCPTMDNDHGRGYMGNPGLFVMVEDCPLHPTEIFFDKDADDEP